MKKMKEIPIRLKAFRRNIFNKFFWLEHLDLTFKRYNEGNGNIYAAGLTYYSIFAIFPILMVAFAIFGFIFSSHPHLLDSIYDSLPDSISDSNREMIIKTVNSAIDSRGTVGIVGLVLALLSGLGYIANLRAGLTAMWNRPIIKRNFIKAKLEDLFTLIVILLLGAVLIGISIVSQSVLLDHFMDFLHISNSGVARIFVKLFSLATSILVSSLFFSFILGHLPMVKVKWVYALRAGLLASIIFQIFLFFAVNYIKSVTSGPAGSTFGPIVGLMVFLYIVSRILLMLSAWISTFPVTTITTEDADTTKDT